MRYISELCQEHLQIEKGEGSFLLPGSGFPAALPSAPLSVNIVALGDVGSHLLLGLRLLGGREIRRLGIFDLDEKTMRRYEAEMNQIVSPDGAPMPRVEITEDPLDGDLTLFCATAGVPPVEEGGDVRLVQFDANRRILDLYGKMAEEKGYEGGFFIVSDPVDPLCQAACNLGFREEQLRGFGLGVMYARALYFAQDPRLFAARGRVFGPHGEDLVVADDIEAYDEEGSLRLTEQVVTANLAMRELGFKPYLAPALSSGALSLLALLRGEWQYSSLSFGKVFLGVKNRLTPEGREVEDLPLEEALFARIRKASEGLERFS